VQLDRNTPLSVRFWRPTDLPAVLEALDSPDMDRQFPDGPTTNARAAAWLDWAVVRTSRYPGLVFAVCADDDVPLANIAATNIDDHDVAWVSYWTTGRARGLGIAADALTALVPWLHDWARIDRLELGHRLNNPASGRIAERAGFLKEGIERGKLRYDGVRYDTARWARLAADPRTEVSGRVNVPIRYGRLRASNIDAAEMRAEADAFFGEDRLGDYDPFTPREDKEDTVAVLRNQASRAQGAKPIEHDEAKRLLREAAAENVRRTKEA
jgi:ribosomal-protein-alanine N-acetyltransferase